MNGELNDIFGGHKVVLDEENKQEEKVVEKDSSIDSINFNTNNNESTVNESNTTNETIKPIDEVNNNINTNENNEDTNNINKIKDSINDSNETIKPINEINDNVNINTNDNNEITNPINEDNSNNIKPIDDTDNKNIDNFDINNSNSNDINKSFSILEAYGENLTSKEYITNPAIAREDEIKKIILILLSPEKSVVLTGKAGIGKTAIVEGISYMIEKGEVPDAIKNYEIIKINTSSLLGSYIKDGVEESKLQTLINELKNKENIILFIDEVHTLVIESRNGEIDFINMLKPGLDRGSIKIIGATTTQEYEQFLLKDKAFLRRFEKVEVEEPDAETTVKILMGSVKKIEKNTNVKFPYSNWILEEVCRFLVNMTSEYKRVYETGARYPDVSLALLSKCFTYARFENSPNVTFKHIYLAIKNCTSVYDDVIRKEMPLFKEKFAEWLEKEKVEME